MFSIQKGVSILINLFILQTIVKGECENLPQVPDSSNNATEHGPLADGSVVEFTCNPGYKGVGSTYYYCRGTEWAGNFSCRRYCPHIKTPQNGLIVGNPEYVVNTRLEFSCLDGYKIVGYSSLLCLEDGNWIPETPPTCDPVSCGDFGSVPNGQVSQINPDDVSNDFGSEIRITCNEGYNLIGSPTVTCKSDGTWSSKVECEASRCGTHPGSKSQCIYDSSTSPDGILLSLICRDYSVNVSVTVVGTGIAFCIGNRWDNLDMGCFCDCLVDMDSKEGISYNNLFNKKFVKHGDQLNWDCEKGYQKQGSTNLSCYDGKIVGPSSLFKRADGNWRPETPPACDPVRCGDFGSVPNGEVSQINPDGVLNDVGSEIRITCNDGFILIGSPTVTCRSDGTWNTRPQCKISSCGTHPGLKSKCIRHIATSDDGSIFSMLCHDNAVDVSVTVVGTGTAFCENNQWDNLDMGCFCDCLVDIDSKEGISYNNLFNKKFVKHGDQLNWDCEKGYRKQGSTNISCYDGLMEKPHCVRKKELNEHTEHGTKSAIIVTVVIVIVVVLVVLAITCVVVYKKKGRGNDQCDTETPTTQSTSDQFDLEPLNTQSRYD